MMENAVRGGARPAPLVSQDSVKSTGTATTSTSQSRAPSPCPPINENANVKAVTSPMKVFMCDIKVFYKWVDPFLIGRKEGSTIDFKEKGVFNPDLSIQNAFEITETSLSAKLVDGSTGEVKQTVCYKGTFFITAMTLQLFPFDCQNLQLTFRPHKLSSSDLQLISLPALESAMERSITHEWSVLNHCCLISPTDPAASSTNKSYSSASIIVLVKRKSGWFVSNIFIPTFLLLMISWLTFLYSVSSRSDRNDISMATLLASIGNKYVVADQLPKVDYRTLVDVYVECCFILQAMTVFATAVVTHWNDVNISYYHGYITLNSILFGIEFLIFLILHDWIYIRLHNHEIDVSKWLSESLRANKGTEHTDGCGTEKSPKKSSVLGVLTSVYVKLITDRVTFLSTKAEANYYQKESQDKNVDSFGTNGNDSFLNFGVRPGTLKTVINSEKRRLSIAAENNLILLATAAAVVDGIKLEVALHKCDPKDPDGAATLITRAWNRYITLKKKNSLVNNNRARREKHERDHAAKIITTFFRRFYITSDKLRRNKSMK